MNGTEFHQALQRNNYNAFGWIKVGERKRGEKKKSTGIVGAPWKIDILSSDDKWIDSQIRLQANILFGEFQKEIQALERSILKENQTSKCHLRW